MEKINWILQMGEAVENRNYDNVKALCREVVNVQGHEPCCSFCPFVSACDWIENLTGVLPDGTKV